MRIPSCYGYCCALLLIALVACMPGATPSNARAAGNFRVYLPQLISAAQPPIEQQMLDLVNQQRQQNGCAALVLSAQLTAAASAHSQDMAVHDLFSHTGSDGSTMVKRIEATGYSYSMIAENLAAGSSTAAEVMDGWMKSPGHRANILDCELRELGVGYYVQMNDQSNVRLENGQFGGPYRYYWTQDFGTQLMR